MFAGILTRLPLRLTSTLYGLLRLLFKAAKGSERQRMKIKRIVNHSALYIWGDFTQGGLVKKIRDALNDAGEHGLTRSQLNDALGGRIPADEFVPEIEKMISKNEVVQFFKQTNGRRATIYKLRQ